MKITVDHIQAAGYCVTGARRFCHEHGLSLKKLIWEGGLDSEELEKIDDEMVREILRVAYGQQ